MKKILVLGDVHADFSALNALISRRRPDIILQCGDFGYWPREMKYEPRSRLKNKNTLIHFCDGNHEDHAALALLREGSGQPHGHEIAPNCFYQDRGSTIRLPDGQTVLFVGGADSIDKHLRTEGVDWFPQEILTENDLGRLPDGQVDIVISHTAPRCFGIQTFFPPHPWATSPDPSEIALDAVFERYRPRRWFFGHWHKFLAGEHDGCRWTGLNSLGLGSGAFAWILPGNATLDTAP